MGPGDHLAARQFLHLVEINVHTFLSEEIHDPIFPLLPARPELFTEPGQLRVPVPETVTQDVAVGIVLGAQLHPADHLNAQSFPGPLGLVHPRDGIVVGDGQYRQSPFLCQLYQLRRSVLPVGGGGVGVQVTQGGHTPLSGLAATTRITGGSSLP